MTVGSAEAASPAPDFRQLLRDIKFSAPPPRPGAVSRSALVKVARASECRVVAVTAPAGYGKSTFMAQWAAGEDRGVAWVSLDRYDDDPVRMLSSLAAAYVRAGLGRVDLVADIAGGGLSVLGRAAPRLAAEFRASAVPFVLMLDDLHVVQSPACHDVLSVVVAAIPPGSVLAAASRFEQPHVPRLRALGEVLEFGIGELALDAAGARQIFASAQVSLSPQGAAAVTERTEGWPAGLYLAARISKETGDDVEKVTGDDRYVTDYLYREAFSSQPEEMQRFLRRTAVLDQLSGALCDAVLGSTGAAVHLRRLEASNAFVISLDRRREWFRYHDLYREFLLGELRRKEPGAVEALHLRAADWYRAQGAGRLAVEHLLHTSDHDRTMRVVCDASFTAVLRGQVSTVWRWIATIGDANIERYPPLAAQVLSLCTVSGDTAQAERWAAFVDTATFDGEMPDGWPSYEGVRAMQRAELCAAGVESMLSDATFAEAAAPPWLSGPALDDTVLGWRPGALRLLAEAHLLAGDTGQARARFAETSALATEWHHHDAMIASESMLGLLAMDRGDWQQAAGHVNRALATINDQRMQDYPISLLAFAGAARLAVHHGDLSEAHRQLTQAMRARPAATYILPYVAVRLRLQLAKVHRAIGDLATARQLLREIDDILTHRPALGTLTDEVEQLRHTLASSPGEQASTMPLTAAELRLLPYLQTHLTASGIAQRLFVSQHTVKSQMKSIYRKLGVTTRSDVVEKATTVGLLGA